LLVIQHCKELAAGKEGVGERHGPVAGGDDVHWREGGKEGGREGGREGGMVYVKRSTGMICKKGGREGGRAHTRTLSDASDPVTEFSSVGGSGREEDKGDVGGEHDDDLGREGGREGGRGVRVWKAKEGREGGREVERTSSQTTPRSVSLT